VPIVKMPPMEGEDLPSHVRRRRLRPTREEEVGAEGSAFLFRRWVPKELVPYVPTATDHYLTRTGNGHEWHVALGKGKSWPELIRRDPGAYVFYLMLVGNSDRVLVEALRAWLDDHPEQPPRLRRVSIGKLAKAARRMATRKAKPTAHPWPRFLTAEHRAWLRALRKAQERERSGGPMIEPPLLVRAALEWEEEQGAPRQEPDPLDLSEVDPSHTLTPRDRAVLVDFILCVLRPVLSRLAMRQHYSASRKAKTPAGR
jgi:hypothetical protein